jgi:linoleoyl-CoA desaturase
VESANGFFIMHYTAGLILSIVFQLAHVVEETENPTPNELGEMEYLGNSSTIYNN